MINVLVTPSPVDSEGAKQCLADNGLGRMRQRLEDARVELQATSVSGSTDVVSRRIGALIEDLDRIIAGDGMVEPAPAAGANAAAGAAAPAIGTAAVTSMDIASMAAAIAEHLRATGGMPSLTRRARRSAARRNAKRRSLLSSILQVDVILSTVALSIALVVLFAWMG